MRNITPDERVSRNCNVRAGRGAWHLPNSNKNQRLENLGLVIGELWFVIGDPPPALLERGV
jgi:hypothetical protein